MAESSCDAAAVAETIEGSVDGISHQTQVSPHVIVDVPAVNEREVVDLDSEWVNSIKGKASHGPRKIKASFSSCSIHRIPPDLRHFDANNYVPQIISIGPLHYAKREDVLQAMEEHKWRYLHAILDRNGQDYLLRCLRKVKQLEEKARECYSEEIDGLDSNSFVEMLVVDACFIIELFCRFSGITSSEIDDPILELVLCPTIRIDLIKLENQIPFFILQELSNLIDISDSSLSDMARTFFSANSSLRCMFTESSIEYRNLQCDHLLHFLHLNCLLSFENEYPPSEDPGPIPCASELQEAGIEFKKGDASSFLQIKYREGKIEIPPLEISPTAEPMLLNLVSFEQCCPQIKPHITSYIFFMDYLINSARDVKILSQEGIIIEELGSSEDIAALFNKIGRDIGMDPTKNYLSSVSERIKQSSKSVWPRFRATLMRDYFNNPWAFISFLAAVVLLVFTFFQTFFSAFPKYQLQK
ncbi:hypothetical protein AAC387_Pa09g0809 [Persea americana]